jgi:hypothetical protein
LSNLSPKSVHTLLGDFFIFLKHNDEINVLLSKEGGKRMTSCLIVILIMVSGCQQTASEISIPQKEIKTEQDGPLILEKVSRLSISSESLNDSRLAIE